VQELMPLLHSLDNLQEFGITSDPWVNRNYFSRYHVDDRLLDAIDDAKDESPLNEDLETVFTAIFDALRSATKAWVIGFMEAHQASVVREDDGTVSRVVHDNLRPSGRIDDDCNYSPFPTVFPDNRPPWVRC
jgi:hypothetical protein